MYNEEQKQRFLAYAKGCFVPDSIINFRSLFNVTEPFEKELEKDVSCFSRAEISNMYSMLAYGNPYSLATNNGKLSRYTEWCAEQMLVPDGCNHFKEINGSDFELYVNQRVQSNRYLTREQLDEFLKEIPNPRDQFVVLSFFEFGKSDEFSEIFHMRIQDIDFENKKVKLFTGRTVSVSDRWLKTAKEAYETDQYYQPLSEIYRKMYVDDHIFRMVMTGKATNNLRDGANNNKTIARLLKTLVDISGQNKGINASSLAVSGQIDLIRRRSKELGITAEEFVLKHFEELEAQYIMKPNNPRKFINRYKAYL